MVTDAFHKADADYDPELRFLLACCRVAVDDKPSAKSELSQSSQSGFDWTRLVEEALWHGVLPLVHAGVALAGNQSLPAEIGSALDIYMQRHARRVEQRVRSLLEILGALHDAGVRAIPFKGPLLAQMLYGSAAYRESRDLDILVRACDKAAALRVLDQVGYMASRAEMQLSPRARAAVHRFNGQAILWHRETQVPVEPHWAFAPWVMAVDMDYDAIWGRAGETRLAGMLVSCLDLADAFIVLCVHGSKEHWSRLKLIADVARFLVVYDALDWPAVIERSRKQGCLRMILLGILLAHRFFDVEMPRVLIDILRNDRVAGSLVRRVHQSSVLTHFDPRGLNHDRISMFRLLMRERFRDQSTYAARTLFIPREVHFRMLSLPDSLFFLYYLIKLAHDYLLLPAWTAMKKLGMVRPSQHGLL